MNFVNRVKNSNANIFVIFISFIVPVIGVIASIRNWKRNADAAKIYALASVVGFIVSYIRLG